MQEQTNRQQESILQKENTVYRSLDVSGTFRVFMGDMTGMAEDLRKINHSTPTATAVLGRVAAGASMMGMMAKGEKDRLTLTFNGNGPGGKVVAVADSKGNVKAYMENPTIELPLNQAGKLDVGGAVGRQGMLTVVRDFGFGEPYVGQVKLVSGEIAEDITAYFAASEQMPTAVALGVLVDRDMSVRRAGGFIIQVLPHPDERVLTKLEENIGKLTSFTSLMEEEGDLLGVYERVFEGIQMDPPIVSHPAFRCDCSRERMEQALISLGAKELEDMIREDGKAELVCHFCRRRYLFGKEQLEELAAQLREEKKG